MIPVIYPSYPEQFVRNKSTSNNRREHSANFLSNVRSHHVLGHHFNISLNNEWKSYKYVFIGGDHHSGTTLTAQLLSSQANFSGTDSIFHVQLKLS
jgi:hypothetical protein